MNGKSSVINNNIDVFLREKMADVRPLRRQPHWAENALPALCLLGKCALSKLAVDTRGVFGENHFCC
ncbi:MAG: hypothetical protein RR477_05800, partial [Raoultibacter sp.]